MKYNTIRSSVPGNRIAGESSDFDAESEFEFSINFEGLSFGFCCFSGEEGFADSKKLQRRLTTLPPPPPPRPDSTSFVSERSSCGGFCGGGSLRSVVRERLKKENLDDVVLAPLLLFPSSAIDPVFSHHETQKWFSFKQVNNYN